MKSSTVRTKKPKATGGATLSLVKDKVSQKPTPQGLIPAGEAISRRAYEIWEETGHLSGRDEANWLQAEQELLSGRK